MAIFGWLFGRSKSRADKPQIVADGWVKSENGNSVPIEGSTRVTTFQQDCVWKYCIADVDDRQEPFFSEAYDSEREAREEALAHLHGEPSSHQPLSVLVAEDRRERWESRIRERAQLIEELQDFLAEKPDLGIMALRKPEAKIASHLEQLEW